MKKVILAFMFFLALGLCEASAQGLKGSDGGFCFGRGADIPKVLGSTDQDRWNNVSKVGPRLIGMSRAEIESRLGAGYFDKKRQQLQYAVTEDTKSGNGYCYTNLMLHFRDGKVDRFVVSSVDWSG